MPGKKATDARDELDELKHYGRLDRKIPTDVLLTPVKIECDGETLRWSFGRKASLRGFRDSQKLRRRLREMPTVDAIRGLWKPVIVPPGDFLLQAFAGLADAPPKRVLGFASKWGVLGICKHDLPCSHSPDCVPTGWDGQGGSERVQHWRRYARQARSLLIVAGRLHDGRRAFSWADEEMVPLLDWLRWRQTLTGRFKRPTPRLLLGDPVKLLAKAIEKSMRTRLEDTRLGKTKLTPLDMWHVLQDAMNDWIGWGGVRPWFLLSGPLNAKHAPSIRNVVFAPEPKMLVPSFPLFSTLAMRLLAAVSNSKGMVPCANCGNLFDPHDSRQTFCPEAECRKAATRERVRRHRDNARKAAASA